jgi:hypothetical protein
MQIKDGTILRRINTGSYWRVIAVKEPDAFWCECVSKTITPHYITKEDIEKGLYEIGTEAEQVLYGNAKDI